MGRGRVLEWALSVLGSITVPVPNMGGRGCGYPRGSPGRHAFKVLDFAYGDPGELITAGQGIPEPVKTTRISVMNRDPTSVLSAGLPSAPWGSWPGGRAGHEPRT